VPTPRHMWVRGDSGPHGDPDLELRKSPEEVGPFPNAANPLDVLADVVLRNTIGVSLPQIVRHLGI